MRNHDGSLRHLFHSTRLRNREINFDDGQLKMDNLKPVVNYWKAVTIKPSEAYLKRKHVDQEPTTEVLVATINPHKVYNPFNPNDTVLKPISKL